MQKVFWRHQRLSVWRSLKVFPKLFYNQKVNLLKANINTFNVYLENYIMALNKGHQNWDWITLQIICATHLSLGISAKIFLISKRVVLQPTPIFCAPTLNFYPTKSFSKVGCRAWTVWCKAWTSFWNRPSITLL